MRRRTARPTWPAPTPRSRASHEAFQSWRDVAPGERAALLRRFAAVVDAHVDELAELEVRNAGHTWGNARWEAGNVRDCLNYYAGAPGAAVRPADPGRRRHRHHLPRAARRGRRDRAVELPDADRRVGLRARRWRPATPWCSSRPSSRPLTAIRLGELALEAGPARARADRAARQGVGRRRAVRDPPSWCARSCFTGSTEVGKRIMAGCADQVKRVTLELGGKSSNIVFADADVAAAAASAPYAVFDNAGQDCCARSRILVERSAYDEFLAGLEKAVTGAAGARPGRRVLRDGAAGLVGPARLGAGLPRRGRGRVRGLDAGRRRLLARRRAW